jgi:hypothetical protein
MFFLKQDPGVPAQTIALCFGFVLASSFFTISNIQQQETNKKQ